MGPLLLLLPDGASYDGGDFTCWLRVWGAACGEPRDADVCGGRGDEDDSFRLRARRVAKQNTQKKKEKRNGVGGGNKNV